MTTDHELPDPATPAEIDSVAQRLSMWLEESPDFIKHQRVVAFDSTVLRELLTERGQLDQVNPRDLLLAKLTAKYGAAVDRVPGADPQDLLLLHTFGNVSV
jgi:hypothetical protein